MLRNKNAKTKRLQKGKARSGYFKRAHASIQAQRRRIVRAARPVIVVRFAPWSQKKQMRAAANYQAELLRRAAQKEAAEQRRSSAASKTKKSNYEEAQRQSYLNDLSYYR